jgi:molybdopterin-guanine dinucleotide biosynthesis protein A
MTFSGLLLAGGQSRRMGRDKATMEFRGQPLWERQLQLLRALAPDKIFVSARTAPAWLPGDVELLLDDPPSRGPLSGLTKALVSVRTTHLIALAVDMPFMTSDELGRLVEQVTEGCGIVPIIGNHAEPLAAIYAAEAVNAFKAALAGADSSLQPLVRELAAIGKVKLWPVANEHAQFYQSLNEPCDVKL